MNISELKKKDVVVVGRITNRKAVGEEAAHAQEEEAGEPNYATGTMPTTTHGVHFFRFGKVRPK